MQKDVSASCHVCLCVSGGMRAAGIRTHEVTTKTHALHTPQIPTSHAVHIPTRPQVLEANYLWLTARDASLPPALWAAAADGGRAAALAAAAAAAVQRLRAAGEASEVGHGRGRVF